MKMEDKDFWSWERDRQEDTEIHGVSRCLRANLLVFACPGICFLNHTGHKSHTSFKRSDMKSPKAIYKSHL